MEILEKIKKTFEIEIIELQKVLNKIDKNAREAVEMIISTKGKVVVTGIGKSGIIGKKIAATLSSTGTQAVFMNSAEGIHGDLGMISFEDVVLAISNSGNTDEIMAIIPAIKQIGAKIIAMTGNVNSKLAKISDVVLDIGVENEGCPINLAPMASTTAALVMGDALAAALIEKRNFKPENFALYHPGGSLGRRLLLRVKDVMHKGDEIPKVNTDASIERVLIELSAKKMGAVCVCKDNLLIGLITEGDVRRALRKKQEFFNLKAQDLMTENPLCITQEKMAVDALGMMENRESQISVLPVIDGKEVIGIIRIHDLIGRVG